MKDAAPYLLHVRDAIERIRRYAPATREQFLTDTLVQDAIVRNLEVIGEAVKHLPESVRGQQPQIPWSQIAGMRDVLIHKYFGVELALVWQVIQQDIGPLQAAIESLLAAAGETTAADDAR